MFKRKFNKLVNNPKLFFTDMAIKHSNKLSYLKPKKLEGSNKYTVVSAVYNVGRYLEDYFNSLTKQRLDFEKHIQLVLVDDGSTDDSAEIIKRWKKKYPYNIIYLYKENGGQASARNLGISKAEHPWITFIDPDDSINKDYFYEVDKFLLLNKSKKISFIACNLIFYFEDKNCFSDTHPQKFKFEQDVIYDCNNFKKAFQLSASSSFFLKDKIIRNNVAFDDKVKPNYEDGHFISMYLIDQNKEKAAFLKNPIYYYRKRSDSSSTLDRSWQDERRYSDVFTYGYLDVLRQYQKKNKLIPVHIQRSVLYDMIWYLKKLINNNDTISFLSEHKKSDLFNLIKTTFEYIDDKTINEFELAGCWFYHKIGILSCFKNTIPSYNIAYITEFDKSKSQALIIYYTSRASLEQFKVNNKEVIPDHTKTVKHTIVDEIFIYERRIWLPIRCDGNLVINLGSLKARISINGKMYNDSLPINKIITLPKPKPEYENIKITDDEYTDSWLFMDRDTHADDNAEHLYLYILKNKLPQKIFYIIKRESHDWVRLQNEGFNLIEYGSYNHKKAIMQCSKIISSHADYFITNYLGKNTLSNKHFVFLQHGVTKDDLSSWLNKKEHIDLFVTATLPEYQSIVSDDTKYKYTTKEVKLTGFPRHDTLLRKSKLLKNDNSIIIMPTWRSWLAGKRTGDGSNSEYLDNFKESNYAITWSNFFNNETLKKLQYLYGFKLVLVPHPNIEKYLHELSIPDYIECKPMSSIGIQEVLASCSALITDYSSIAFEAAVINKPVIYFQFDETEFFSGKHTYSKGYYDYRKDGFGPVITNEEYLLTYLEELIINKYQQPEKFQNIVDQTFPYRDEQSSFRTYNAIVSLDKKEENNETQPLNKYNYALQATLSKEWSIAEKRWRELAITYNDHAHLDIQLHIIESLRKQGKYTQAELLLNTIDNSDNSDIQLEKIYLAMARHQWGKAISMLNDIQFKTSDLKILYIRSLAEARLNIELDRFLLSCLDLPEPQKSYASIWRSICKEEWDDAIVQLATRLKNLTTNELYDYNPQLLISRCYRHINQLDVAHEQLVAYEKHSKNVPQCREEIALLANRRGQWGKIYNQITSVYPTAEDIPEPIAAIVINALQQQALQIANSLSKATLPETVLMQVKSLREKGYITKAKILLEENISIKDNNNFRDHFLIESARLAMSLHYWQQAISYWEQLNVHTIEAGMARLRCLAELGRSKAIKRTIIDANWMHELPKDQFKFAEALLEYSRNNFTEATNLLYLIVDNYSADKVFLHKPHLWLSRCLRLQGAYDAAHKQLVEYEKIINNDIQCREQIALLAWERSNYEKIIQQLSKSYTDVNDMPESMLLLLFSALQKNNRFDILSEKSNKLDPTIRKRVFEKLENILKSSHLSVVA
ncbi:CDP-glycerol glycerophosphotransferase family protein [Escherichia coli]